PGPIPAIGEGEFLPVAGCAGGGSVHRHPFIVEKITAQLHFLRRQRVIGGYQRLREALRYVRWAAAGGSPSEGEANTRRNRNPAASRDHRPDPRLIRTTLESSPFMVKYRSV